MRANETTIPPCVGTAPPHNPVPAPRGTIGTPQVARDADDRGDVARVGRHDRSVGERQVAARVVGIVRIRRQVLRLTLDGVPSQG